MKSSNGTITINHKSYFSSSDLRFLAVTIFNRPFEEATNVEFREGVRVFLDYQVILIFNARLAPQTKLSFLLTSSSIENIETRHHSNIATNRHKHLDCSFDHNHKNIRSNSLRVQFIEG